MGASTQSEGRWEMQRGEARKRTYKIKFVNVLLMNIEEKMSWSCETHILIGGKDT